MTARDPLARLRARLDRDLLAHLQAHCAEQAARIEALTVQVEQLQREVFEADSACEMWCNTAHALMNPEGGPAPEVGITRTGQIIVMQGAPS